jgi:molecular chaperone GrpE
MDDNKTINPEAEAEVENAEAEVAEDIEKETGREESAAAEEAEEKSSRGEKKKLKRAEAEIAELQVKLAEENDKYLRLFAEYDNFRKRSAKEKEGIYTDAYIDALTQILPILDNLDRAAQYGEADSESPMAKGLELTRKSFVDTLAKMGVEEIEALGKPFDPNLHNAVMHIDDETFGENEVVEVFMKGYAKGDKVLRHSMVKVAN